MLPSRGLLASKMRLYHSASVTIVRHAHDAHKKTLCRANRRSRPRPPALLHRQRRGAELAADEVHGAGLHLSPQPSPPAPRSCDGGGRLCVVARHVGQGLGADTAAVAAGSPGPAGGCWRQTRASWAPACETRLARWRRRRSRIIHGLPVCVASEAVIGFAGDDGEARTWQRRTAPQPSHSHSRTLARHAGGGQRTWGPTRRRMAAGSSCGRRVRAARQGRHAAAAAGIRRQPRAPPKVPGASSGRSAAAGCGRSWCAARAAR